MTTLLSYLTETNQGASTLQAACNGNLFITMFVMLSLDPHTDPIFDHLRLESNYYPLFLKLGVVAHKLSVPTFRV